MLDIKLIRDDPDGVAAALGRRGGEYPLKQVLEMDARRRDLQTRADELRAEQKRASKDVPTLQGDERQSLLARLKGLSADVSDLETQERETEEALRELMLSLPNLPHESVPDGLSEEDNVIVRTSAEPQTIDGALDHVAIGEALGLLDIERAAKVSGSRFAYVMRELVLLELALVRFAMETLTRAGFVPVVPPVLVHREALEGTGFLPHGEQQIYKTADDDLYLAGTAEIPLGALHMNEILDAGALPLRYAGFSTCFRREAGTYGKDMGGLFRVHQFDKVEMFSFTRPEDSWDELEMIREREEEIFTALEIPYRVVALCAGDLSYPSAKTYDLEAWLPGQGAWREITSCSNCTDFQARRLGARVRGERGVEALHTLNGTAVAVGRTLIAIVENFQQPDGSVVVPDALRAWCGFDRIGPR